MSESLLAPGDVVAGKYRIQSVLGQGGMGVVYAAYHELLAQPVALKILRRSAVESSDAIMRFVREARAAASIKNEHVVRVMDVGVAESLGVPYMVMDLLDGTDVERMLASRGRLPIAVAVGYVLQALEAIAAAHVEGIVHRDLKPANLFVAQTEDGAEVLKVLDFGISKKIGDLGTSAQAAATSTKQILGTPMYMSPEQLRSSRSVDARTDIWALGVLLFQMIADQTPFDGETIGDLFASIFEGPAPRLRSRRSEVPPALDDIVARCLERKPEDRFSDVAELAAALAPFGGPGAAASLERVRRSFVRARDPRRTTAANATAPASSPVIGTTGPAPTRTAAGWATSSGRVESRTRIVGLALLAGAVATTAVAGVVGVRLSRSPLVAGHPSAPLVSASAVASEPSVVVPDPPAVIPATATTAADSAKAAPTLAPRRRAPPAGSARRPIPSATSSTPANGALQHERE
jgi:serine/threonine-protein kinase